ncbi:hypothetical protein BDK51DRAFT_44448 [Blyttiomyces helicus]|uniref:Uncharacterized protein n=1 Tax=Blyttiomyces helicus TaxID=388810 RepID=A0A4P9W5A6_9FUNG|nr:hypothetical protein BDK51DRAFT_44448 [Blyttiomyces helicus]|eukprot:RKO86475.1 hypothetical protein BDK51DRAFT_44448 [Blyttiomyces helicus]
MAWSTIQKPEARPILSVGEQSYGSIPTPADPDLIAPAPEHQNDASNSDFDPRPESLKTFYHEAAMIVTLSGAALFNTIALGGVTIMLPTIGREFDMNQADLSWILAAFT